MKPKVRCYYWGEAGPMVNLGDLLVPTLLGALGYACAPRATDDADVVNPGRCLLVVGSLLTRRDLEAIAYPADVWGCGWKGAEEAPPGEEGTRFLAVRGPQTAAGLHLPPDIALGDPALLVPHLVPLDYRGHGRAIVIPHFSRLSAVHGSRRCSLTGCDEVVSPLVLRAPRGRAGARALPMVVAGLLQRRLRDEIPTRDLRQTLRRIAGARFVLAGSLHGAVLAQAFGVPWAALDDGYVDAPAKWNDWAAYLGVDIELVRTLRDGESWWRQHGRHGSTRSLGALLRAFPYGILAPRAKGLAQEWS